MSETDNTEDELAAPDEDTEAFAGEIVEVELAQGLGLAEALTIGAGTMICAGIFVLPGLVIGRVGPAAVLSFFLGGVVALFCAMSAAEVATGMPKSGGGYYFISRALGPLWGAIIGWGSWFGLIFASAFYMVGFGEYVHTVLGVPVKALGIGMTVLLVGLNLIGSKAAGQVQNLSVAVLIGVLVVFQVRGAASADLGLVTKDFMPFGVGAVIAGTAMLFVAYCGFGEIASMAEEIKQPGKNLPRALLGSVIGVTVLYCTVLLICVALRPWEELQSSTLVADLADDLMGGWGRGAITLGAVMATVSSANASIMSASRVSFAMGRDRLVWDWLNQVHPRFRVPHRAIIVTGLLTIAIVGLGDIRLLAETAGLLHLLLYGLICVACVILRGARSGAYRPTYRAPLFPLVPLLGAAGCVAVAFFMDRLTLLLGCGLIAFALAHFYLWARKRTELHGAWPYFLRRGILEPGLRQVERWGATADELPTAMVAVAHVEREEARLRIVGAMMGPTGGQVLVVNVFLVDQEGTVTPEVLAAYRQTIADRGEALQEVAAPIIRAGGRVTSHVPVSSSVLFGLLSAAEASCASLVFVGWPEPGPHQADQLGLLAALDQYLAAHMLVLRERGPVPAQTILALIEPGMHGDLALLAATRMTNAWGATLTVAALVPADAAPDVIAAAEEELEERVGDVVRATVQAIPAPSAAAAAAEASFCDLIVSGVPAGENRLPEAIIDLEDVTQCSLALARAGEGQPLDIGM